LREVTAFIPGLKYLSISITGSYCTLMCDFCRANYLDGMRKALTPKEFYDLVKHLVRSGAKGVLISGGFNRDGYLPIEPYLPVIKDIKNNYDILVSVHIGLADKSLASKLRDSKVDVVDYELILDDYVIKNLMHLGGKSSEDFIKSYETLINYGPSYIVPHIPIGMNYGRVVKEMEAANTALAYKPEVLVFLIFKPTAGTPMANVRPPGDDEVLRVIRYTRDNYSGEIALGCMRPLEKKYTLDFKLIDLGLIDRIANPLKSLVSKYGLKMVELCCSIPKDLIDRV